MGCRYVLGKCLCLNVMIHIYREYITHIEAREQTDRGGDTHAGGPPRIDSHHASVVCPCFGYISKRHVPTYPP